MDSPICQFTKGPRLGGGTYGEVYSVTTPDRRQYAAKFIRERNDFESRGLSSDALLEIDTLVRFKNFPEVVQLIDICYQDNQVIILLEKMNSNLRTFLLETPFDQRLTLAPTLLLTLSRALTIFTILHIVHFDLKPENILVGDGPVFKIGDFGLSRQVFPYFTYPGEFFTSWYRPPEYLAHRNRSTFQASAGDIWTIGLTLVDFLAGKVAIYGDSPQEILESIRRWSRPDMTPEDFLEANAKGSISGRIDVYRLLQNRSRDDLQLDQIDPALLEMISEMLQLNPDHRLSSAQILERYGEAITEQDLLPFIPPEFPRRIIPSGIQMIVRVAHDLNLGRIPTLVALEIYTRFLGALPSSDLPRGKSTLLRGLPADTYALTCLQIGARLFGSFRTIRLINSYQRFSKNRRVSIESIAAAEQDILRNINFLIYNLNLAPVIDRAYEQQRDLTKVPAINFDQPLNGWLKLGGPEEITLSPFQVVQNLIETGQVSRFEFESELQSLTLSPHHLLTVMDLTGQTYYVIVDYDPQTNQIFPP